MTVVARLSRIETQVAYRLSHYRRNCCQEFEMCVQFRTEINSSCTILRHPELNSRTFIIIVIIVSYGFNAPGRPTSASPSSRTFFSPMLSAEQWWRSVIHLGGPGPNHLFTLQSSFLLSIGLSRGSPAANHFDAIYTVKQLVHIRV